MKKYIRTLLERRRFKQQLPQIAQALGNLIFCFPYCAMGGGERVHAGILKTFAHCRPSCIITIPSTDHTFRADFAAHSTLIDLSSYHHIHDDWFVRRIAALINQKTAPTVFGCNSQFFCRLLPHLSEHVRIIDLFHAFVPEFDNVPEKLTLPHAEKIHARIVLGEKTKRDFQALYQQHHKNPELLKRIHIIPNQINVPDHCPDKPEHTHPTILFVGRASEEKRPELFIEIARRCQTLLPTARFEMIGDIPPDTPVPPNTRILGVISEMDELNRRYQAADLILITSWREGLPMVMLEAMAYGVIPVSTDVGEISSLVNPQNHNGLTVTDHSVAKYEQRQAVSSADFDAAVEAFLAPIIRLAQNHELRRKMSQNAHQSVKQHFSPQAHQAAYLSVVLGENEGKS